MLAHRLATALLSCLLLAACSSKITAASGAATAGDSPALASEGPVSAEDKVTLSEEEWRELLDDTQFRILRQKGTERAFTGKYLQNKAAGTYLCAACGLPLFSSDTKFESGTGWPSFWAPVEEGHVATEADHSHGMSRTEILCERCGGHLGHVFADGPEPTGLRYCVNSVSLVFEPKS